MKKTISIALIVGATTLMAEAPITQKLTPQFDKYGIVTKQSAVDVNTTINRLQKIVKKKGITFFNRIDHAQNSRNTGAKNVLDSQLLIFGKPSVGLKLLANDPRVGLDLPLKILAYQTKEGEVFVSYRDVAYLSTIYNLAGSQIPNKMSKMLNKLTNIIIKSPEEFKNLMNK